MLKLRYLANVTTLSLNEEKCMSCGRCLEVCPHEVFALEAGKARIADRDGCMECGACAKNCPHKAIAVEAGVGCAAAIISRVLGGAKSDCGCSGSDCCG